jgi:hypothetical protein
METSRKYRFLVWICLRLRLSITLKSGYSITTFKMSNNAMAPELQKGDLVAADTAPTDRPYAVGDMVVASVKCPVSDGSQPDGDSERDGDAVEHLDCDALDASVERDVPLASDALAESDASEDADTERRLIVRKVAAVAGDPIPPTLRAKASARGSKGGATVPEGCVFLLANKPSEGPDSRTPGIGPRPLTDILGRIVAVRKRGRITWL